MLTKQGHRGVVNRNFSHIGKINSILNSTSKRPVSKQSLNFKVGMPFSIAVCEREVNGSTETSLDVVSGRLGLNKSYKVVQALNQFDPNNFHLRIVFHLVKKECLSYQMENYVNESLN